MSLVDGAGPSLLEVDGLVAGYGRMEVVHGVSFHVDAGEIVVILGANGAGKTTTLRALCGMIPRRGRVCFDGVDVPVRSGPERLARNRLVHVPQGRGTIVDLTVEENLEVGAYLRRDRRSVQASIARWYELFPPLARRRGAAAATLSGGEQQMLAVARALMSEPRLVLLDEPGLGLAPLITQDLFAHLGQVVAELGIALLLVEQNAELALRLASRGYVMESGAITLEAPAEELRRTDSVRRAYLGV